ncbi:MAG: serine/threonine protein kinase [Hyalangium sp.]|uniref:serine/threonine protein kinase n=1 Tax=Hyalangium sp. TaxID=2028555 RepID=UPI0038998E92
MEAQPLAPDEDPRALPLGTRIGAWRVSGYGGVGVYGAVYKALRVGHEEAGPVALKLALCPRDPRFEREARLLSIIRHSSVPRLLDAGQWRHSSGFMHPYIVMEWIDGSPLYSWAARRNPSSAQVMRLLAQGAQAMHAMHSVGGVHRDIKGDNVMVRAADGRFFLGDFGSGHYPGAERLTPSVLPPSTPAYRSPEAWDYARRHGHLPFALYVAQPSDDVFAFGIMAYRLVTDEYPPSPESRMAEGRCWLPGGGGPRPPRALNPRVDPRLDALILRMLSSKPEERGTAEELAEALEQRAAHAGPEAEVPLFDWETLERSEWPPEEAAEAGFSGHRLRRREREEVRRAAEMDAAAQAKTERPAVEAQPSAAASREHVTPHERSGRWLALLALVAAVALALWPRGTVPERTEDEPPMVRNSPEEEERDGGSISVGDAGLTSSYSPTKGSPGASSGGAIAVEVPPKPQPGQIKPDGNGRCRKGQIAINGGCWFETKVALEDCSGNGVVYRGGCYVPAYPSDREPTSTRMKK